MSIEKEYKEALYKSLTEDIDSWKTESFGAWDCSWIEYHSKVYGNRTEETQIQFCIGNLNFGTCVYVNGMVQVTVRYWPFSKMSKAIKAMKKHLKDKANKINNSELSGAINNFNNIELNTETNTVHRPEIIKI